MRIKPFTFISLGILTIILFQAVTCLILISLNIELVFFRVYRSFFEGQSLLYAIPIICVFGPAFETAFFQAAPIDYIKEFKNKYSDFIAVVISTSLFSAAHIANGSFYPLMVLPGGIILALTYMRYKNESKGFIYTLILHGIYNLGLMILLKVWHSS